MYHTVGVVRRATHTDRTFQLNVGQPYPDGFLLFPFCRWVTLRQSSSSLPMNTWLLGRETKLRIKFLVSLSFSAQPSKTSPTSARTRPSKLYMECPRIPSADSLEPHHLSPFSLPPTETSLHETNLKHRSCLCLSFFHGFLLSNGIFQTP